MSMNVHILNLEGRRREDPFEIVSPADFKFSAGNSIDAQVVIENPNISLYCLDHENRRAIFVETPGSIDLSQAPFYFQVQYENAIGLFGVPYEILYRLANDIHLDSKRLILIYSVGRCGSTLLSSVFNQVEDIVSMSEPDVFTQIVAIREWDGSNEAQVSELLQSCTKVLCKSPGRNRLILAWAIKFRSFGIEIADLLFKYFPETRTIFLYRDAETWWKSNYRAFVQDDIKASAYLTMAQAWLSPLVPLVAQYSSEKGALSSLVKVGTLMWLSVMERYLTLYEQGAPMLAVRFKDLTTAPERVIREIFKYCGFKTSNLTEVFKVMGEDSQAGTLLSREKLRRIEVNLTDEHKAEMAQILQSRPIIQTPDYILPNTLDLE